MPESNMPEKISSLHDDVLTPIDDRKLTEYDPKKGYPIRLPNIGERGENSVINRISQFGITEKDLLALGIETPFDITESQYNILLKEAIKTQYDTLFASVFKRWPEIETSQEQREIVKKVSEIYKQWGLNHILRGKQVSQDGPNLVISLEGADSVKNLEDIGEIYDNGIRSVVVQYGRENALADIDGLTNFGQQAVSKMLDLGISVDLAHAYPNTRGDILTLAKELDKGTLVAYTHGASNEDIAEDPQFGGMAEARGLSKEEMRKIIKLGGIIGLGVTRPFFGSIEKIAARIDKICQLENGASSVGLGTDFGGVPSSFLIGINKPEDVAKIGNTLSVRFGYTDSTIRNILRQNVNQWVSKVIGVNTHTKLGS